MSINKYSIFCLSILVLITTLVFFELSNFDIKIQSLFYNNEHHQWLINKQSALPKLIFYDGMKVLYALIVLSLIISLLFTNRFIFLRSYRKGLIIAVLSTLLIPLSVNGLKAISNMPCPSDTSNFNGQYPHVGLFEHYPSSQQPKSNLRCYPAGHASGGFALISLLYLFHTRKNRIIALSSAVTLGWTVGIYKMMIGDHFISHTIVSMEIAWIFIQTIHIVVNVISSKTKKEK